MKSKNTKFNIVYCTFILFFIIISSFVLEGLSAYAEKTFKAVGLYRVTFIMLFIFGIIIGVEHLINEKRKKGKWKVNKIKLIILGIPSFLVVILNWVPIVFKIMIINPVYLPILHQDIISNYSVILFGWVLTTSIYKYDLEDS